MTVARQLASWGQRLAIDDVEKSAQAAAVRHILDGTGVACAALRLGTARSTLEVAVGLGGPPEATPFGMPDAISAPAAALANGALVHALDFDDTHAESLVHATAVVIPAALAVGEQVGATGTEVLIAALVGYEVACRLGAAAPHGFHARGLHATAVCGPLAAAAVTARLMKLEIVKTVSALGIAASSSGGLLEFLATGASTKQLHPGLASHAGVLAARLAAAGAEGPDSAIEGSRGLYAALSAREVDLERITSGLGERWEVERMTIKPYPCCQLMHAALDAAERLRPRLTDLGAVEELEVIVHPDSHAIVAEPAADKLVPRTLYDAKFSLPWSLAALLLDGRITVDTYAPGALRRADVRALAARVHTVSGSSAGAAADAPARIVARLRDGARLQVEVPCSSGGPARPLTEAALREKFVANSGASAEAAELADRVLHLQAQPSLAGIRESASLLGSGAVA